MRITVSERHSLRPQRQSGVAWRGYSRKTPATSPARTLCSDGSYAHIRTLHITAGVTSGVCKKCGDKKEYSETGTNVVNWQSEFTAVSIERSELLLLEE